MRLLLDAHISGRRVGQPLREAGHDVRAADSEPELEGAEDPDLLEIATSEERVLVTFNIQDFPQITREWMERGHRHAGVILVPNSVRHEHFGTIISGVQKTLGNSLQEEWVDRVEWMLR